MTDVELSALEAAAKAATPGPWDKGDSMLSGGVWVLGPATDTKSICITGYARGESSNENNAAYIAAANPAIVLELIAELRQARAERDWMADYIATLTGKKSYNTKEHWIKAAKEATCQK